MEFINDHMISFDIICNYFQNLKKNTKHGLELDRKKV